MFHYRAVCPDCGSRLPRVEAFNWTTRTGCPDCGAPLRQNLLWAFALTVSVMFPMGVLGLLVLANKLHVVTVLSFFVCFMLIAFGVFPYVISYRRDVAPAATAERSSRSFVWAMAKRFWWERLTPCGRSLTLGALVTAMAGVAPAQMAGAYTFGCLFMMALMALALACWMRPNVQVHRRGPDRCMAGSQVLWSMDLTNVSNRSLVDVGAHEFRLPRGTKLQGPPRYLSELSPGQTRRLDRMLHAMRRGVYRMHGPTALCSFPFAVVNAKRHVSQPHRLTVYPSFVPLREMAMPLIRHVHWDGDGMTGQLGDSMTFAGNREYQAGDRVRDLHPRSWARLGMPIVKQYEQASLKRVAVVVDAHLPGGRPFGFRRISCGPQGRFHASSRQWFRAGVGDQHKRWVLSLDHPNAYVFEAGLSLAAAVADYLARRKYGMDLLVVGAKVQHFPQTCRDDVLDVLAELEPSKQDLMDRLKPMVVEHLPPQAALVVILTHWNRHRENFLKAMEESGTAVKAVLVTESKALTTRARAWGVTVVAPQDVEQGVERL